MGEVWIAIIGIIGTLAGTIISTFMARGKTLPRQSVEEARSDTYKKVLLPLCSKLSNEKIVTEIFDYLMQNREEFVMIPSSIEYHFELYKNCDNEYKKQAYEIFKKEVYDTFNYYEKHNNLGQFNKNRTFRPLQKAYAKFFLFLTIAMIMIFIGVSFISINWEILYIFEFLSLPFLFLSFINYPEVKKAKKLLNSINNKLS